MSRLSTRGGFDHTLRTMKAINRHSNVEQRRWLRRRLRLTLRQRTQEVLTELVALLESQVPADGVGEAGQGGKADV